MEIFFFLFIAFLFWMVFAGNKSGVKTAARGQEAMLPRRGSIDQAPEPSVWETNWNSGGGRVADEVSNLSSYQPRYKPNSVLSRATLSPKARARAAKTAKATARMAATRLGRKVLVDDRNLSRRMMPNGRARQVFTGKTMTAILGLSGLTLYVLSLF